MNLAFVLPRIYSPLTGSHGLTFSCLQSPWCAKNGNMNGNILQRYFTHKNFYSCQSPSSSCIREKHIFHNVIHPPPTHTQTLALILLVEHLDFCDKKDKKE